MPILSAVLPADATPGGTCNSFMVKKWPGDGDEALRIARLLHGGLPTYGIVQGSRICTRELIGERLGVVLPQSVAEFSHLTLSHPELKEQIALFCTSTTSLSHVTSLDSAKLLAPLDGRPKIICVGGNYFDHLRESGGKRSQEPVLFMKPYTAMTGPEDPIEYPSVVKQLDYEGELGVVIGRRCRGLDLDRAYDHILGYTVFNDISARDLQFGDGQWTRGKSFDTFAPTGPWIVTREEIPDPHELRIVTKVNGETRQNSVTSDMIFKVDQIVRFVSMVMTLEPGDIIATGTPGGVGIFAKPEPRLLGIGDIVEVMIEGIGKISNPVVRGSV